MAKLISKRVPAGHTQRHAEVVARLSRHTEGATFERLRACSESSPCGRDGCPNCSWRYCRDFKAAFFAAKLKHAAWLHVVGEFLPEADYGPIETDPMLLVQRLSKQLERSRIGGLLVIGAVRPVLRQHEDEAGLWVWQLELMVNTDDRRVVQDTLEDLAISARWSFPAQVWKFEVGEYVKRVVGDGFEWICTYESVAKNEQGGVCRRYALSPKARAALVERLIQYPIGCRLILRNIRRVIVPGRSMSLRVLNPSLL